MTQEEIKHQLNVLYFQGGWTVRGIAKESGLSESTIKAAGNGEMSAVTQTRLEMAFKIIPAKMPKPQKLPVKYPGEKRRFFRRYFNLTAWLNALQKEPEIKKIYVRALEHKMSKRECAFTCCKLDYIGKRYLMDIFGEELKKKKVSMGDCYPFERWVELIKTKLPRMRPELMNKITHREVKKRKEKKDG